MMATEVRPHKERMWDDNLGVLAAIKKVLGDWAHKHFSTLRTLRARSALPPRLSAGGLGHQANRRSAYVRFFDSLNPFRCAGREQEMTT